MIKELFNKQIIISLGILTIFIFSISVNAGNLQLDSTFGTDGIAVYDFDGVPTTSTDNDEAYDVAVQPDGKIVMVGQAYVTTSNRALAIMRFNADGTLDTTFGDNGRILNDYTTGGDQYRAVAIQPDGKILAAGYVDGTRTRIVVRYNPDGTLDSSFGTDGIFTAPLAYSNNTVTQDNALLLLQPDGKILVAGTHKHEAGADRFGLYRLNENGTLDATFGNNGEASARFTAAAPNFGDRPFGIELQDDGKIVAAGYANADDVAVARWNADGTLDTTFGTEGKVTTDFGTTDASAWSMTIQPDGKILTAGRLLINSSDVLLVRYNTDGSLDTTFDDDGIATADFGLFDHAYKVFVRDGKIITVGDTVQGFNGDFLIAQFNMDGSVDTSFGTNGAVKTTINNYDFTYSATFSPDGKLVIGGFSQFSGTRGRDFTALRYVFRTVNTANDFDGDGRSDISILRTYNGGGSTQWWIQNSSTNSLAITHWGIATDVETPADFDGDGRTDIAVWRPAPATEAKFLILNSSDNTLREEAFGQTGDTPIAGDYDSDGLADLAVYRESSQSTFFYRGSNNNPNGDTTFIPFGTTGDKPVRGDFNGDGKLDFTVFRNGEWWTLYNGAFNTDVKQWGAIGDKLVAGDYDGDGITDQAVFRPADGVWYIRNSSDDTITYQQWGISTDTPVPADYDGDGRWDAAVYREGIWYILNSTDQSVRYENFGVSTDIPVSTYGVQ